MSKLRFVRDETTNDVTFRVREKAKAINITLKLNDFSLALMAGKEVDCSISESTYIPKTSVKEVKKKKGKKK
jgi:hypothetical protein